MPGRFDEARFDLTDPAVNFTLNAGEPTDAGRLNHLGIQVSDAASVQAANRRLVSLGFLTRLEEQVDCCYAPQDKVWVQDPGGNPWEIRPRRTPRLLRPCV